MFCVASPRNQVCKISKRIKWEKPPAGWKKLNTDGSVLGSMERAGCGGVVRDEHGSRVVGFTRHVGATNSFTADLWGLRDGFVLCSSLNISYLTIEIDAKVIVDVLQNSEYVNHIVSPILDDCRNLMTRFQQVQVKHCYRQVNHCTDLMARLGAEQELEYRLFSSPTVDLAKALEDDCNGVFSNRLCSEQVVLF